MLAEQLLQSAGLRIGDPLTLPLGVLCMRMGLQFVDPPARSGCRLSCRWTNFQIGYLSACVSALDKYVRIAKADKVPMWYVVSVVFANAFALLRTPWERSSFSLCFSLLLEGYVAETAARLQNRVRDRWSNRL